MATVTLRQALTQHWPEYLIEGWALGMFMVSAGLVGVLLEAPASPLHALIASADLRRVLAGVAMGATAIALIYSKWGQRSGAHMNPAVTATFYLLGKTRGWDALFYIGAQFAGGLLGVEFVAWFAGAAFTSSEVNYVVTAPGPGGPGIAFLAEVGISGLLMYSVLTVSGRPRLAPYTGLLAGILVACFISLEAPLSGMSMNPARSFASAAPSGMWAHLWVYFTAPLLGMGGAAALRTLLNGRDRAGCAKFVHPLDARCIHCGYEPELAVRTDTRRLPASQSLTRTESST